MLKCSWLALLRDLGASIQSQTYPDNLQGAALDPHCGNVEHPPIRMDELMKHEIQKRSQCNHNKLRMHIKHKKKWRWMTMQQPRVRHRVARTVHGWWPKVWYEPEAQNQGE